MQIEKLKQIIKTIVQEELDHRAEMEKSASDKIRQLLRQVIYEIQPGDAKTPPATQEY